MHEDSWMYRNMNLSRYKNKFAFGRVKCHKPRSKLALLPVIFHKEALAIRRIFSLVDMITKAKFSNSPNDFKFVCLSSIICIVSIKIHSKAIHHLQSLENLRFLLPPLILRLYTGCRLDQNFRKTIIGFQKVNLLGYKCPSFPKLCSIPSAHAYEIYLKL